jgi:hypothetical protein
MAKRIKDRQYNGQKDKGHIDKPKIEQLELHQKQGVNSGVPEG